MGTRCLTVFHYEESDEEIAVLYRQMDGYPDGHGKDLAEFLAGGVMVNGISLDKRRSKIFNGMECLAAQVIAYFKNGPGGFYLMPAGTRDVGENYIYHIREEPGKEPTIEIEGLCKGSASEVLAKILADEFEDM
jgi:hypothetical protein